jgi:hypothetical protein
MFFGRAKPIPHDPPSGQRASTLRPPHLGSRSLAPLTNFETAPFDRSGTSTRAIQDDREPEPPTVRFSK